MMVSSAADARSARALAALRIGVGALFLIFGEYKVFGARFAFGGGFEYWINRFLDAQAAYPFMVPVLRDFVLQHATPIALLVAYGELAIGLALCLGVLTRPASACGLAYMLTLLFSADYPGAGAAAWQYFGAAIDHLVLALCFAAFLLGAPDARMTVSRCLHRRTPQPPDSTHQRLGGYHPGAEGEGSRMQLCRPDPPVSDP